MAKNQKPDKQTLPGAPVTMPPSIADGAFAVDKQSENGVTLTAGNTGKPPDVLKNEKQPDGERTTMYVLTDGGIGKLAARHGIDLVVVPEGANKQRILDSAKPAQDQIKALIDEAVTAPDDQRTIAMARVHRAMDEYHEMLCNGDPRRLLNADTNAAVSKLLGAFDMEPANAELRGVLIHTVPGDGHKKAGYDRVGNRFQVAKLTVTREGITVEKMREVEEGRQVTEMAWHLARDHAERILEMHMVPEDYR